MRIRYWIQGLCRDNATGSIANATPFFLKKINMFQRLQNTCPDTVKWVDACGGIACIQRTKHIPPLRHLNAEYCFSPRSPGLLVWTGFRFRSHLIPLVRPSWVSRRSRAASCTSSYQRWKKPPPILLPAIMVISTFTRFGFSCMSYLIWNRLFTNLHYVNRYLNVYFYKSNCTLITWCKWN